MNAPHEGPSVGGTGPAIGSASGPASPHPVTTPAAAPATAPASSDAVAARHILSTSPRWALTALGIAIGICALYFGRHLFVPFSLAVLLCFVLDPFASRLRQWGVPKGLAVALVMVFTLATTGAASVFVGSQIVTLSKNLPTYEDTIHAKLRGVRKVLTGRGMFDDVSRLVDVVEGELDATRTALEAGQKPVTRQPLPVRVEPRPPSPWQSIVQTVEPIITPLATAGIVLVLVMFILLERSDLRDRALRLVGGDLHRGTDATNEAARRVSRYLTTQLLVNLGFAVPMSIGLAVIGVPGALLWGLLAGLLRFLPYVGPALGICFPLTMAFAVDPGWSMMLWTLALFLSLECVVNYLIEPRLYGAHTGLAPMAVLLSATFWATLWGPIGLVLATPLTATLVAMSRHISTLRFLDVMLGSEPAFDPPTRIYRRLLSGDVDEVIELASEEAATRSVQAFYQHSGVPSLRLAADDRALDASELQRGQVVQGIATLLDVLEDEHAASATGGTGGTGGTGATGATSAIDATRWPGRRVLCVGMRWELDGLAARMLAHTLTTLDCDARCATGSSDAPTLSAERLGNLDADGVDVVCLSSFSPAPQARVRYACRRLRRQHPQARIVVALWRADPAWLTREVQDSLGADAYAHDIDGAVSAVEALLPARPASHAAESPAPTSAAEGNGGRLSPDAPAAAGLAAAPSA